MSQEQGPSTSQEPPPPLPLSSSVLGRILQFLTFDVPDADADVPDADREAELARRRSKVFKIFDKCTTSTTTTKIGTDGERELFSYILDITRTKYQTRLARNHIIVPY